MKRRYPNLKFIHYEVDGARCRAKKKHLALLL